MSGEFGFKRTPFLASFCSPEASRGSEGATTVSVDQTAALPALEASVRGEQVVEAEIESEVPDLN